MPSFDIVSEVNLQEVKNAVDQTDREISQRYDFKDSNATIELKEKEGLIMLHGPDKLRMTALQEILRQKLAKRGISQKSVTFEEPQPAGGDTLRQSVTIKQALNDEEKKRINKLIKETKLKVTSQIQGDQVRVTGKKRDDLQTAIATLRSSITDIELQFTNFRD
jgi:cyclic-di-GMP-binding protein